jgi:hypothetical protein
MNLSTRTTFASIRKEKAAQFHLKKEEIGYFVVEGTSRIMPIILNMTGSGSNSAMNELVDVSEASDQLNISVLSTPVSKYLLCYPKNLIA